MNIERVFEIFRETGVMLDGHFLFTSGRHGDKYMQCAQLFRFPQYTDEILEDLAKRFEGEQIDLVIGPAVGAVQMSFAMARILGCENIFAERENGVMTLRRGFHIEPGQKVLVVEDVVTTGGSVQEEMCIRDRTHCGESGESGDRHCPAGIGFHVGRSLCPERQHP